MKTFTIDNDNNITVFASAEEAAATSSTPFDSFGSEKDLAELAIAWPAARLLATWNGLPGVTPVAKFKDHKTAVSRIWKRIQTLGEPAPPAGSDPKPVEVAKPKATGTAKGAARGAHGTPKKARVAKKAGGAKDAPKPKRGAQAPDKAPQLRQGTKTAQVVAMLQRKNGATLAEIMEKMNWQRHTVRGFMSGAMRKAGYAVESFKPEGGERSYRINK